MFLQLISFVALKIPELVKVSSNGVILLVLDFKQQLGSSLLRVVVDAYFCKVPFLAPLVSAGIPVITRMRKDGVAWDKRIENQGKKRVKLNFLSNCSWQQSSFVENSITGDRL